MLRLQNISCHIGVKMLLKSIDFQVKPRTTTVILGPNGVGKSSLIRLVAGHRSGQLKANGKILLRGQDIATYKWKKLAIWRALMPQKLKLNFPLKVEETIALGWSIFPISKEEECRIQNKLIEDLNLQTLVGRNILTLSGGEQQRVQLARVLAQLLAARVLNPRVEEQVLLLDEPTASLDLHYQHLFLTRIRAIAEAWNLAILVILHDLNLAARYADQIVLLGRGKQLAFGSVEEVLTPPNIETAFNLKSIIQTHPIINCPQVITY